jgi:hypothetical protein
VLLALHLFTLCGHILLYQYFVYKSDKFFNEQISKGRYNTDDLVEIKVPVDMPNVKNWESYVRIGGQIQFRDACYNYVKLKLTRDTIYVVCIPNYEKTRLINENIIDAKQIADMPISKKDHVPFGKTVSLDSYNYPVTLYLVSPKPITLPIVNNYSRLNLVLRYPDTPDQPPKYYANLS